LLSIILKLDSASQNPVINQGFTLRIGESLEEQLVLLLWFVNKETENNKGSIKVFVAVAKKNHFYVCIHGSRNK
jgi:hypothetical protein